MPLQCVTLTGADDSIDPFELIKLLAEFPFVEFGILYGSSSPTGSTRFPSTEWLSRLNLHINEAKCRDQIQLSLHICGEPLRGLIRHGVWNPPAEIKNLPFRRAQLNFHGEALTHLQMMVVAKAMARHQIAKQIIVQLDGVNDACLRICLDHRVDAVGLFDRSHGGGVSPEAWPDPARVEAGFESLEYKYFGFAGGIGLENIEQEIIRIKQAAGDRNFWIDMETKLFGTNNQFGIDICRLILEKSTHYILDMNYKPSPPFAAPDPETAAAMLTERNSFAAAEQSAPPRQIYSHRGSLLNDVLKITACGDPGPGGAHTRYRIEPTVGNATGMLLEFHTGPLGNHHYPTGLSIEALIAVCIDRLEGFQRGDFRNRENAIAVTHLETALLFLQKRTRERQARGVEGLMVK